MLYKKLPEGTTGGGKWHKRAAMPLFYVREISAAPPPPKGTKQELILDDGNNK